MMEMAICALRHQEGVMALEGARSDAKKREDSQSFINKLYSSISRGIPFAEVVSSSRTDESDVVYGVLQMLQGFSSPLFTWEETGQSFVVKNGKFVSHLSQSSLGCILDQFVYSATCLKLVEHFVRKVETLRNGFPTLKAFAYSVSLWLKRLRNIALNEEVKSYALDSEATATLLGLTNPLSSLCSGAEHLMQVVYGAVPSDYFHTESSITAAEMAVLILDYLFRKLNDMSLVQGGEEEAYHMLVVIFVGSVLPYLRGLDSWIYDGTLDDPYEEMFFYSNNAVTIDQAAFWDKSYLLRSWRFRSSSDTSPSPSDGDYTIQVKGGRGHVEHILGGNHTDPDVVCPVFLKDIARAIVSAGKSLKLVQYVHKEFDSIFGRDSDSKKKGFEMRESLSSRSHMSNNMDYAGAEPECTSSLDSEPESVIGDHLTNDSVAYLRQMFSARGMRVLTLSELFLVSLVGLVGDGNHIFEDLRILYQSFPEISKVCKRYTEKQMPEKESGRCGLLPLYSEKFWYKFLLDTIVQKNSKLYNQKEFGVDCMTKDVGNSVASEEVNESVILCRQEINNVYRTDETAFSQSFYPENPAITVCKEFLGKRSDFWDELNISGNFHLPSLNDELLREAIFGGCFTGDSVSSSQQNERIYPRFRGTDYMFGFNEFECLRLVDDVNALESLYPFPTILPCVTEDAPLSDLLPFQDDSTLASRILNWIQGAKLKTKPHTAVILQSCLLVYINKQVDWVGKHILLKLMNDWRLMEELRVLRAIYLLGSGDILQQFLVVIFGKLDKGGSWDDDFELNTILQESIRNSADGVILSAPDSLTVSIIKNNSSDNVEYATNPGSTPRKVQNQRIGVNDLDVLEFTYKVSWPLDLIINVETVKKYNQVMRFLLKVKHAKFVLDKTRRWMWKRRGVMTRDHKHQLVEQKLLHFVDAFHQYVMDRVFHSAWIELCHNMASAGSLDEVIEVHDAYLLSVQRQCFVAPDKLWALIASRIKSILRLALDFYSIQQTLCTGGAAPAIKARCEMEVDRIEKQFDDCISFLLRILSFKLNIGQFPHLADLVTRINYNHFYMSDKGNLLTTPSFETSKLGKTYLNRTD